METKQRLATILVSMAIFVFIGISVYHQLEGWSLVDSLYFSTVTMSTGHGYLAPTHTSTKLFTVFFMLIMASSFLVLLTIIGDLYVKHSRAQLEGRLVGIQKKMVRETRPWRGSTGAGFTNWIRKMKVKSG